MSPDQVIFACFLTGLLIGLAAYITRLIHQEAKVDLDLFICDLGKCHKPGHQYKIRRQSKYGCGLLRWTDTACNDCFTIEKQAHEGIKE